jgi:hypothetical protein
MVAMRGGTACPVDLVLVDPVAELAALPDEDGPGGVVHGFAVIEAPQLAPAQLRVKEESVPNRGLIEFSQMSCL